MPPPDRADAERLYALTDRLQIQLRMLEEARSPVHVRITVARVEGDIEALAFLVRMQASRAAREDLKAIMDSVREINEAKAVLRDTIKDQPATDLDFESIVKLMATLYERELEDIRDKMDEMVQLDQLYLQATMERLNKQMSALSNLLKKISDISSQIAQSLR